MRLIRAVVLVMILALQAGAGEAEKWIHLSRENGLPGNEIQFLRERNDGAIWIGTLTGLGYWRDGKCHILLNGHQVWDVTPAEANGYWIGTKNGVIYRGEKPARTELKGWSIAPLIPVGENHIWAIAKQAQESRIVRYDGKSWSAVEKFKDVDVEDMFKTADGRLWITVEGDGVLVCRPGTEVPPARHLDGRNITAFQENGKQQVWCGTWERGLYVLEGGNWIRHLAREDSPILNIDVDSAGKAWVATGAHGLWRQGAKGWVNDLREEGGINLLEPTSDGRVWISNQIAGGLRYWDGKKWLQALPGPLPMRCVLETSEGDIWVGGILNGVHVLKKEKK